ILLSVWRACLAHSLPNNHKYEDLTPDRWPDVTHGFSKLQEEAIRERQEQLVRFVSDFTTASSKTVPGVSNTTKPQHNHRFHPGRPYRKQQRASFASPRPPRTANEESLNFIPKDEIRPGDVVGLIPPEMFKVSSTKAPATSEAVSPDDSETGRSSDVEWHYI
ncbi:unnamed protein product, partial [Nesidiocoris tenuis]